ncbi:MAG: MFS transporter [Nanoarchaeota archaeon]|nr:MFS transporter [Nanoarchaeota archaeon]
MSSEDLKKTRKYSVVEGSFASVASGAGDSYIVPYALALNANNAHIGMLSSLGGILGPISQIFGSRLIEKFERKKIVLLFVALQASMWLMFILAGLLFLKSFFPEYIIPFLITVYISYIVLGSVASPSWFSMMGDVVPEKIRGKYFSRRNKINGGISLAVTLLAALWLDHLGKTNLVIIGFISLFAISAFGRFMSAYYFTKHSPPKLKLEKGYYFSFFQFIKKAPFNNFGRFAIFVALITLTMNIAGPFYAVYMLKELQFSYVWFTIINMSAGIVSISFIPFWGHFADKYGNRELLRITSMALPFLPLLWIFSPSPIYLILVPQLLGGLAWGGFNLAASNFIYDAVTSQRRGIVVAYYSMLNGFGVFIGAGIGAVLAQYVNLKFINTFFFLFIIAGFSSAIVIFSLISKLKEVRQEVHPPNKNPFTYLREARPIFGVVKFRSNPLSSFRLISRKKKIKR